MCWLPASVIYRLLIASKHSANLGYCLHGSRIHTTEGSQMLSNAVKRKSDLSLQSGHDSGRIRCGESRSLSTHGSWRWRHRTWCRSHTCRWLTFWLRWWRWFGTTGFCGFSSFPSCLYGFRVCEKLRRDVSRGYYIVWGSYSLLRSPRHRLY